MVLVLSFLSWSQTNFELETIGYNLTDQHLRYLQSFLWLNSTRQMGQKTIVGKIEKFIQQEAPEIANPSKLAQKIYRSAWAFGIDPIIWAALIRQESIFNLKAKSPTGALGLTQITTIAMSEIRNQLGVGDPSFVPRGQAILEGLLMNYFRNPAAVVSYKEWVRATRNQSIYVKGLTTNEDYSLVSGALLLKLYLSLNYGQYPNALEYYNGSKIKKTYRKEVLEHSYRIQRMHQDYSEWVKKVLNHARQLQEPGQFEIFMINPPTHHAL